MQFYYGAQNILRALDEAEFWKHQETEHAGLIPIVTPNLESLYVQTLEKFGLELHDMNSEAVKYIESVTRSQGVISRELRIQMYDFIKRCLEQSERFVEFMEEMLQKSDAVHSSKPSQDVINHMIRESRYFIGIAQLVLT